MAKPGLIGRAIAAAQLMAGKKVDQSDWFGPQEPLPPMAPKEVTGRRFDLMPGFNLVTSPRGADGSGTARIDFKELRALADNYDLLRLVIETRKDQLAKLTWSIRARDEAKRGNNDPRVAAATSLFERPDREHSWETWLRALVEDMLVIDAPTLYPRRSRGGQLYGFEVIDGATIKPVIDDHGRRPLPPLPAYQQILVGLPAVDYTSDQIFYFPRNYRSNLVYGYSPVEQVVMTVNVGLRRQLHQLQFYTEGTMPDVLVGVPDTWAPTQIEEFQAYFDALCTDNTAQRRKARFVPQGIAKSVVFTKENALKDEMDEWLARVVSYAFSVSPQWAIKQMNRATADTAQEQALQEGLSPLLQWAKNVIDQCLAFGFGWNDLEFAWDEEDSVDPNEQNTILLAQLERGAITLDEFRAEVGREPYPDGIGEQPMIFTASGAVRLRDVLEPPAPPPAPAAAPDAGNGAIIETPQGAKEAPAGANAPPNGQDRKIERAPALAATKKGVTEGAEPMAKASGAGRPVPARRPAARKTETALAAVWRPLLDSEGKRLAAAAQLGRRMAKADTPGPGAAGGAGAGQNNDDDFQLDPDAWDEAEEESRKLLEALAIDSAGAQLGVLGLDDANIVKLANPRALAWAKAHAAELVSQIADTTRQRVNDLVSQAENEGWPVQKLSDAIRDDDVFSAKRALLIAHTETRNADNQGALAGAQAAQDAGVQVEKRWYARGDHVCLVCQSNEDDGWIDTGDDFNSGDDAAPAHPNCECDTEYRVKEQNT